MNNRISQLDLIMEYFTDNPCRDIEHREAVDYITEEYKRRTGRVFRDVDRGIRSLSQKGHLIKVRKGVYRYDPDMVYERELEDFTPAQKKIILERDGYKCVICGMGVAEGCELQVDHIKPKQLGGEATVENGQTLCASHNFKKKHLGQTETGKKMFIRLYELAEANNDIETKRFCEEVLEVFDRNNMNGHIEWKR